MATLAFHGLTYLAEDPLSNGHKSISSTSPVHSTSLTLAQRLRRLLMPEVAAMPALQRLPVANARAYRARRRSDLTSDAIVALESGKEELAVVLFELIEILEKINEQAAEKAAVELNNSSTTSKDTNEESPFVLMNKHGTALEKLLLETIAPKLDSHMLRCLLAKAVRLMAQLSTSILNAAYDSTIKMIDTAGGNRAGGLYILAECAEVLGTQFVLGAAEIASILQKLCKRAEPIIRQQCALVVASIYRGTKGKTISDIATDTFLRVIQRLSADKVVCVRIAAAHAIESIVLFSNNDRAVHVMLPLCTRLIVDSDTDTCTAYARALSLCFVRVIECANDKVQSSLNIRNFDDVFRHISSIFSHGSKFQRACISLVIDTFLLHADPTGQLLSNSLFGLLSILDGCGINLSDTDTPSIEHAQACCCILHAFHSSIVRIDSNEMLSTIGRSCIALLLHQNSIRPCSLVILVVSLEALSVVLEQIGSGLEHLELRDVALEAVLTYLAHRNETVRNASARCMLQLAACASSYAATWLSVMYKLTTLHYAEMIDAMSINNAEQLLSSYCSMHGHSLALSYLLSCSAIDTNALGINSALLDTLFDLAHKLIAVKPPDVTGVASVLPKQLPEIGWMLVTSMLQISYEWVECHLQALLILLLDELGRKPSVSTNAGLHSELRIRTSAMHALRSLLLTAHEKLSTDIKFNLAALTKRNFSFLRTLLIDKTSIPSLLEAVALFKRVIFDTILAIDPVYIQGSHVSILNYAISELINNESIQNILLSTNLQFDDNILTAKNTSSDAFAAERLTQCSSVFAYRSLIDLSVHMQSCFSVASCAAPAKHNSFLQASEDIASLSESNIFSCFSVQTKFYFFGHHNLFDFDANDAVSRSTMLAAHIFARMMLTVPNAGADAALLQINNLLKKISSRNDFIHGNLCAAILIFSKAMSLNNIAGQPKLSSLLLDAAVICMNVNDPSVRRLAAQTYGRIGSISSDSTLQKMTTHAVDLLNNKSYPLAEAAALSLGCLARESGSRFDPLRSFAIAALFTRMREFHSPFRNWILHSLYIIMSGDSSLESVPALITVIFSHMLAESEFVDLSIYVPVSELLRIIASAMKTSKRGLHHSSRLYGLLVYLREQNSPVVRVNCLQIDELLSSVNRVLPITVIHSLSSVDFDVRAAAIICLEQHIRQMNCDAERAAMIPRVVLLLNSETNLCLQLKLARLLLLFLSSSRHLPTVDKSQHVRFWLFDSCKRALVGFGQRLPSDAFNAYSMTVDDSANGNPDSDIDDDGNNHLGLDTNGVPETNDVRSMASAGQHVRKHTMLLALLLLRWMLNNLVSDADHDLNLVFAKSRSTFPLQYTCEQLPDLMTVVGPLVLSPDVVLRSHAVQLMTTLVEKFSNTFDPDSTNSTELLLSQYTAQLTSSVTSTLRFRDNTRTEPVSPLVLIHGYSLAQRFLVASITDDLSTLSRALKLAVEPLTKHKEFVDAYSQYDGAISTNVLLSSFSAFCSVKLRSMDNDVHAQRLSECMQQVEIDLDQLALYFMTDLLTVTFCTSIHLNEHTGFFYRGFASSASILQRCLCSFAYRILPSLTRLLPASLMTALDWVLWTLVHPRTSSHDLTAVLNTAALFDLATIVPDITSFVGEHPEQIGQRLLDLINATAAVSMTHCTDEEMVAVTTVQTAALHALSSVEVTDREYPLHAAITALHCASLCVHHKILLQMSSLPLLVYSAMTLALKSLNVTHDGVSHTNHTASCVAQSTLALLVTAVSRHHPQALTAVERVFTAVAEQFNNQQQSMTAATHSLSHAFDEHVLASFHFVEAPSRANALLLLLCAAMCSSNSNATHAIHNALNSDETDKSKGVRSAMLYALSIGISHTATRTKKLQGIVLEQYVIPNLNSLLKITSKGCEADVAQNLGALLVAIGSGNREQCSVFVRLLMPWFASVLKYQPLFLDSFSELAHLCGIESFQRHIAELPNQLKEALQAAVTSAQTARSSQVTSKGDPAKRRRGGKSKKINHK